MFTIRMYISTIGLVLACCARADLQLVQLALQGSQVRVGAVHQTPVPTATPHVGTPMPTEIHLDELLNSTVPGFERMGQNCDCGPKIKSFTDEYATLELCAGECLLYDICLSIGFHPWQSIWSGHCDLYSGLCNDTDGHANDTTCSSPTPDMAKNVNFNRIPTPAPTPVPTSVVDPCDVPDGSGPSSFYPCTCGPTTCVTSQICSTDSCATATIIHVAWPCEGSKIGNEYFTLGTPSASGAPVYGNGRGVYLYWDPACDGYERHQVADKRPRWILDDDAPNTTAPRDLDGDGQCQYLGHFGSFDSFGVPFGSTNWEVACNGTQSDMTVEITYVSVPPTPAPTLPPGVPCTCDMGGCGMFQYFDLDADGCLTEAEVDNVEVLRGHFLEIDANGDGCCDRGECAASVYSRELPMFPIQGPAECDFGYYFIDGTSVCKECYTGETRRRRSTSCTPCPPDKEDLGEFDNCIGGAYLTTPIEVGEVIVSINKDVDESGVQLNIGDGITMATRNPGHYERMVIVDKVGFDDSSRLTPAQESMLRKRGKYFEMDHGVHARFQKYDSIVSACTGINGIDLSGKYPCGCGIEVCASGTKCDELCGMNNTVLDSSSGTSYGSGGCCIGPPVSPLPTPNPTVSAKGDPHLVNLQGEHFDINHGGEFTLLRIPQDVSEPAQLSLRATIAPEREKPCTTYITEVELSGSWFGDKSVYVRSYLTSHASNETDKFLGVRVHEHNSRDEALWKEITDWTDDEHLIFEEESRGGFKVTLTKAQWASKKNLKAGKPTTAGQFVVHIQNKLSDDSAMIVARQDLPGQEHLNMAVHHLSALGRPDVGGLLGFDAHPESLEDVTTECQRHRDGLDGNKGPHHSKAWKTKWTKIKERRSEKNHTSGDRMNDNEAAASLTGSESDKMCVCPTSQSMEITEEEYNERLTGGEIEGVMADFQTGRLAEATWD